MTDVVVTDWIFSTCIDCELCGDCPDDYWQMAKVNGQWICLQCLGYMVCDMKKEAWNV